MAGSLEDDRRWFKMMAQASTDPKDRALWKMLADEIENYTPYDPDQESTPGSTPTEADVPLF